MRSGNLFSRYRAVSRWSGLVAAVAMVLLTLAASAQMVGSEKGKKTSGHSTDTKSGEKESG
jgi:hypothetical protein